MEQLPITPAGTSWSQREYIACLRRGIGFASHGTKDGLGSYFHYKLDDRCKTIVVRANAIKEVIDHPFTPDINWIERCRILMMNKER